MKRESLVIADQHAAVNRYLGLVHTARHTIAVGGSGKPAVLPGGISEAGVAAVTGLPAPIVKS